MNPFYKALDEGYSPEDVIGYISKAMPTMAKSISKAKSAGYTVQQILGYLSKTMNPKQYKGMSESSIHELNRQNDAQTAKHGLAMAAGAIAAPLAANAARSALGRALPSQVQSMLGLAQPSLPSTGSPPTSPSQQMQQTPPQMQPLGNQSASQQPPSLGNANIQQQAQPAQPKVFDTNIIKNGLAYRKQIDALIKSGNGPEEIEAYLKKFNPQFIKTIEKEGKGSFKDVVSQYMQEKLRDEAMQPEGSIPNAKTAQNEPQVSQGLESQSKKLDVPKETPKIEKKAIVSTPNGIGEVREIRGGQAIVELDGKLHKVKEEELEASPLPEKELDELYDELLRGIEKETGEDVSRMVQWAGYNPETNTLQFLPHTGKLYKYGDISPEDAALLTDILSVRKSSGENFIGAWKAGSKSPIGAALSKLIRKLQSERGGKGNEYEETHEPIYSAYEPAIQAKKKKKKK